MILAPRYLPRLAATVGLFTRYGLLDFAKRQGLTSIEGRRLRQTGSQARKRRRGREGEGGRFPRAARRARAGVHQARPGALDSPRSPATRLHQGARAPAGQRPADVVRGRREYIEEELDARISKLFAFFDDKPLGSASLGQVHAAQLRDGREVVVKVQRPGIREQLADDIEFFRELARFLTEHTSAGERVDMIGVVQQLERALADELDYRTEARNAAMFRRTLARFPHILIPRVIDAYTTHEVLTTRAHSRREDQRDSADHAHRSRLLELADEFSQGVPASDRGDGHFHADPHPGNIFVVLPREDNPLTPAEAHAADRRLEQREAADAAAQDRSAGDAGSDRRPPIRKIQSSR